MKLLNCIRIKSFLLFKFFLILFSFELNAQTKMQVTYFEEEGKYYDNFGTFDKFKFFHDQTLIDFHSSEEKAIISFYSNTSKKNYDKYVLTNRERMVVYSSGYVKDKKPKIDTIIYNDFDERKARFYQSLDSSQTWIDIYFKLRFKYNNEETCIVSFRIVENGYPQGRKSERIIIRTVNTDKASRPVYYIDKRRDDFLDGLTLAIGNLKKETIRVIFGIDESKTKAEKELISIVNPSSQSLQINTLVNLYKNNDERLMQFYK